MRILSIRFLHQDIGYYPFFEMYSVLRMDGQVSVAAVERSARSGGDRAEQALTYSRIGDKALPSIPRHPHQPFVVFRFKLSKLLVFVTFS